MEILEAFALTNSYRAAAVLAGCSHHTVEHWVTMRDPGLLPDRSVSPAGPGQVDRRVHAQDRGMGGASNGRVRGDVVFDKLVVLGLTGRTARPGGRWPG